MKRSEAVFVSHRGEYLDLYYRSRSSLAKMRLRAENSK